MDVKKQDQEGKETSQDDADAQKDQDKDQKGTERKETDNKSADDKKDGKKTENASGREISLDDFDEDDDENSGEVTIKLTAKQLKDRLKRKEDRVRREEEQKRKKAEEDLADEKRKSEEERLANEKKFEDLANTRLERVTALESRIKELEGEVNGANPYKDAVARLLKAELKNVPEEYRELLEGLSDLKQLDWIAKNRSKFTAEKPKNEKTDEGEKKTEEDDKPEKGKETSKSDKTDDKESTQTRPLPNTPKADEVFKGIPEDVRRSEAQKFGRGIRESF